MLRIRRWDRNGFLRLFLIIEAVVLCLAGLYYASCGEALYARDSDGNIGPVYPDRDAGELVQGRMAVQIYTSQMDRVTSVGVLVSGYENMSGRLYIRFEDLTDGRLAADGVFSAKEAGPDGYFYLDLPKECRIARGHQVKLTLESDCVQGKAPMILYHSGYEFERADVAEQAGFFVDGQMVPGTMCITAKGINDVWTGPNYWKLTVAALLFTAVLYGIEVFRCVRGKNSYLFVVLAAAGRYGFLMRQLIARDFKTRYKRSVLGVFWSFLNPLLTMAIQYVVFSQLFKSDIENYPAYLLSGLVVFNFFNEGVGQALGSVVGNAALITKVYLPKYVYPATRVMSSGINLVMSLVPLVVVALVTGERITKAYLMFPYILVCVLFFTIGLGMVMGTAMVFFRDMQFLWGIISMLWMYVTPLFYPLSIIPAQMRPVFSYNPMLHFTSAVRSIVLDGMAPRPSEMAVCTLLAAGMLMIGCAVFKKNQDKFVFYI